MKSKTIIIALMLIISVSIDGYAADKCSFQNGYDLMKNQYNLFFSEYGFRKANVLEESKRVRSEIEKCRAAQPFLADISLIELCHILYWYTFHKRSVENGSRPYWVDVEDISIKNIIYLGQNLSKCNEKTGIMTMCLLKIVQRIKRNKEYLLDGNAENDLRGYLHLHLSNKNKSIDQQEIWKASRKLKSGEICSIIDEVVLTR